jgi:hypothetical protein
MTRATMAETLITISSFANAVFIRIILYVRRIPAFA